MNDLCYLNIMYNQDKFCSKKKKNQDKHIYSLPPEFDISTKKIVTITIVISLR